MQPAAEPDEVGVGVTGLEPRSRRPAWLPPLPEPGSELGRRGPREVVLLFPAIVDTTTDRERRAGSKEVRNPGEPGGGGRQTAPPGMLQMFTGLWVERGTLEKV